MLIIPLCIGLTGCICNPQANKPTILTEYEFIVRTADAQLKQEPQAPEMIDVETADQTDLATWIAKNDKYINDLRVSRKRLIQFYEKPVTKEEQEAAKLKSKMQDTPKTK